MTHFCCIIIYVVSQSNKLFLRLNMIRQKFYKGRGWLHRSGGRRPSCSRSSNMFILISTHTHTHVLLLSLCHVRLFRVSGSRGRRYLLHTSSSVVPFWSTFISSLSFLETIFFWMVVSYSVIKLKNVSSKAVSSVKGYRICFELLFIFVFHFNFNM